MNIRVLLIKHIGNIYLIKKQIEEYENKIEMFKRFSKLEIDNNLSKWKDVFENQTRFVNGKVTSKRIQPTNL